MWPVRAEQAVAGLLPTTDAEDRRYMLPRPHREVLVDEVSPPDVALRMQFRADTLR